MRTCRLLTDGRFDKIRIHRIHRIHRRQHATDNAGMKWLNRITVYNKAVLHEAVEKRRKDQALVTVSNHRSCIDDPVLWGVLKWQHLVTKNEVMRWALGASEICFTNNFYARFFGYGRVVPVVRGDGVYQPSMDFILKKLNNGGWVHVFPEGKVNETKEDMRLKWGVGRLIAECRIVPLVLPMWHIGMDDILPNRRPYIPHVGKKVTLVIGKPIDFEYMMQQLRSKRNSPMEIRKAITDKIQEELKQLRIYTECIDEKTSGCRRK